MKPLPVSRIQFTLGLAALLLLLALGCGGCAATGAPRAMTQEQHAYMDAVTYRGAFSGGLVWRKRWIEMP